MCSTKNIHSGKANFIYSTPKFLYSRRKKYVQQKIFIQRKKNWPGPHVNINIADFYVICNML